MSQGDVYRLLEELGGRATSKQIAAKAREKYPDRTLSQYVGNRLQKLQNKGCVKRDTDGCWVIIAKYR